MPGQHGEVGAQRPGRRIGAVGMSPQLDEHVLYNVLSGAIVSKHAHGAAVHAARQAVECLGQGTLVFGRHT